MTYFWGHPRVVELIEYLTESESRATKLHQQTYARVSHQLKRKHSLAGEWNQCEVEKWVRNHWTCGAARPAIVIIVINKSGFFLPVTTVMLTLQVEIFPDENINYTHKCIIVKYKYSMCVYTFKFACLLTACTPRDRWTDSGGLNILGKLRIMFVECCKAWQF